MRERNEQFHCEDARRMREGLNEEIAGLKSEWQAAFREMKKYFYNEIFDTFSITYDARTWYRFKNPALIYPMERDCLLYTSPSPRDRG